jgi:hypothetical protein
MNTSIVIKKLSANTFDVFYGETGWDDWARFEIVNNRLHPIICKKQLPQNVMNYLRTKIKKPNYLRRQTKIPN